MPIPVHAQKYLDYKHAGQKPDPATMAGIERSRLIFFTKLFAAVAMIDGEFTESEHNYVLEFYWMNYPDSIAFYLFDRFQKYAAQKIKIEDISSSDYKEISYGEKFFVLCKILEFLNFQKLERRKYETEVTVSGLLGINRDDLDFAKEIYEPEFIARPKFLESKIKFIIFSDDKERSDVFLPFSGLRAMLFNVEKYYFIVKLDPDSVVSAGNFSTGERSAFVMQYGSSIRINDYFVESEDIKLYLKIKYSLFPEREFFVNDYPDQVVLENDKQALSTASVRIKGCKIIISPLDKNTIITVNDKDVQGDAFVNVNDFVKINESFLNLRKLKYQEYFGIEYIKLVRGKTEYTLSNTSGSDIYAADGSEKKWQGRIILKEGKYYINTGDCYHAVWIIRNNRDFQINRQTGMFGGSVKKEKLFLLKNGDVIYIQGNAIKFRLDEGLFEKTRFRYITYKAENLRYYFRDRSAGADDVSLEIDHGDLVCIMGPSGSGKSTLLKILSGMIKPQSGTIKTDNFDFFEYYEKIKRFISFVPQDDALFENLTVYENLYFNAKLRFPKLNEDSISGKVDSVLKETGLFPKRFLKVGAESEKILSGGERKRLNIGFELLSDSNMFFFDEPTSGLSSKDSEKVIEILKGLAVKGKIIFAVIHQPGYKIYNKFNKTVVLDHGGKLAYSGSSFGALSYFRKFNRYDSCFSESGPGKNDPDNILDTLEEPIRDLDGAVLPERKFTPEYWKDQYKAHIKSLRPVKIPPKDIVNDVPTKKYDTEGRIRQFFILFKRNFKNRSRDRSNLLITFLEAPLLAAVVGFILRYVPSTEYTLYNNIHLPIFIFLAVIIGIFLAISNSSDEIIRDREIIRRDKMLDINYFRYYVSKFTTQMIFSSIQNMLFIAVSFAFLEIRELHLYYFLFMMLVSAAGISMGFFISSIPGLTVKAVQNIVPLILIPQIIFGGALIQYKELNTSLTIYKNSPIPEICQFMPSRWAYEGIIVLQDSYNSYHSEKDRMQKEIDSHIALGTDSADPGSGETYQDKKARLLEREISEFRRKYMSKYGNMEVHRTVVSGTERFKMEYDLISYGYPELTEVEKHQKLIYPIFTREKMLPFYNIRLNTALYNGVVLLFITLIVNFCAYWMLSRDEMWRKISRYFRPRRKRA